MPLALSIFYLLDTIYSDCLLWRILVTVILFYLVASESIGPDCIDACFKQMAFSHETSLTTAAFSALCRHSFAQTATE
jgi:hypothetical protein